MESADDQEVYDALRRRIKEEIRVALPAQVLTYDSATNRAECSLVRLNKTAGGATYGPTTTPALPVLWPRWGGAKGARVGIYGELVPGDTVLILVCDRPIGDWIPQGGIVTPQSTHRFNLADGIILPGLYPDTDPLPVSRVGKLYMGKDDGTCTRTMTTTGPGEIVDEAATIKMGLAATEPSVKADTFVTLIDLMLTNALAAVGAPDGGTKAITAMQTAWNTAKATIKTTKLKAE